MKKLFALLLALAAVFALVSCGQKEKTVSGPVPSAEPDPVTSAEPDPGYDPEGYLHVFDCAIELLTDFSRGLLEEVIPPSEVEYKIRMYADRDKDYLALLEQDYLGIAADYTEKYGEGWKITYSVLNVDVKDEEGIEKYLSFDSHYFDVYGVDTSRIQSVAFVKINIHIESKTDYNDKEKTLQCFCIDNKWYSFYGDLLVTKL